MGNVAPSGARSVPLVVFSGDEKFEFYVSKAQLVDGLNFIAEAPDDYVRQARARHIFSNLIRDSYK